MKKLLTILIPLALIAMALFFFLGPKANPAPEVTFRTLDGKTFTTKDLKGKVSLIKFWATTCTTCIKQMPTTIENYQQYKEKGFETIAVAMAYDKPEALKNFIQDWKLPFTVTLDDGTAAKAFGNIRFTPVAILLDRQGNIVKRFIGDYDKKVLTQTLEQTLDSR